MTAAIITKGSPRIDTDSLPFGIKLMPHQKAMVYRMLEIEKTLFGKQTHPFAMMSDKPGAGKSYAILAFLYLANKVVFKGVRPHVNMIVVPYNICTQWNQYLSKIYGPSGSARCGVKYKRLTEYSDIITLYTDPAVLFEFDILLTTSLYFDMIAQTIRSLRLKIQRVFFDEADTIRNLLQTPMECRMTWFVSASIASLFGQSNSLTIGGYKMDLAVLKKHDVACDHDFVNENIVLPDPTTTVLRCDKGGCGDLYYGLLSRAFQMYKRQLQALDYSCVRGDLPMLQIKSEYEACVYVHTDVVKRKAANEERVERLREDYNVAMKKYNSVKDVDQDMASNIWNGIACIDQEIQYVNRIIEDCAYKLSMIDRFKLEHNVRLDGSDGVWCDGKLGVIKRFLKETVLPDPTRQCIVFADYDYVYEQLRQYMKQLGIGYKDLDGGNMDAMDATIGAYKQGRFQVLLADSSMYSCGMNLENTSDILFVHKMDELKEKQVIGRAHRYGRDETLRVWCAAYEGER